MKVKTSTTKEPAQYVGVIKTCSNPECQSSNCRFKYCNNGSTMQPRYKCLDCKKYFSHSPHPTNRPKGRTYTKKLGDAVAHLARNCPRCGTGNEGTKFKYNNNNNSEQPRFQCLKCKKDFQTNVVTPDDGGEPYLKNTSKATQQVEDHLKPQLTPQPDCSTSNPHGFHVEPQAIFQPEYSMSNQDAMPQTGIFTSNQPGYHIDPLAVPQPDYSMFDQATLPVMPQLGYLMPNQVVYVQTATHLQYDPMFQPQYSMENYTQAEHIIEHQAMPAMNHMTEAAEPDQCMSTANHTDEGASTSYLAQVQEAMMSVPDETLSEDALNSWLAELVEEPTTPAKDSEGNEKIARLSPMLDDTESLSAI